MNVIIPYGMFFLHRSHVTFITINSGNSFYWTVYDYNSTSELQATNSYSKLKPKLYFTKDLALLLTLDVRIIRYAKSNKSCHERVRSQASRQWSREMWPQWRVSTCCSKSQCAYHFELWTQGSKQRPCHDKQTGRFPLDQGNKRPRELSVPEHLQHKALWISV